MRHLVRGILQMVEGPFMGFFIGSFVGLFVTAFIVQFLWNWTIPPLFGLTRIGYFDSVKLLLLSSFLVGFAVIVNRPLNRSAANIKSILYQIQYLRKKIR